MPLGNRNKATGATPDKMYSERQYSTAIENERNQVTELQEQLVYKNTQISDLKAELLDLYRRVDRN